MKLTERQQRVVDLFNSGYVMIVSPNPYNKHDIICMKKRGSQTVYVHGNTFNSLVTKRIISETLEIGVWALNTGE